jgi:outer membrane receptor for ferrienterochelin and colicin
MQRLITYLFVVFFLLSASAFAQGDRGALLIRAEDKASGRALVGVQLEVLARDGERREVSTQGTGEVRVDNLSPGLYDISGEIAGYGKVVAAAVRVTPRKTNTLLLELVRRGDKLEEVVVSAQSLRRDLSGPVTSSYMSREQLRTAVGGGSDVLRALDGLPGLASTGEFANFTVRGRGPKDNLIFIDNMPYDKVVHFDSSLGEAEDIAGGGRFSIFAPNLIEGAEFSPGGWSAAYGGKAGSLLKLDVAAGGPSPSASVRLDLAGGELAYEGPSGIDENTSVLFNARYFNWGQLFDTIGENDIGDPVMTDVILKTRTQFDSGDQLEFLLLYTPEDYDRTITHVVESTNFEDVSLLKNEADSMLVGLTWNKFIGNNGQWRSNIYYRANDKTSAEGEAYPDLVPADTPNDLIPVREDILTISEDETEIGMRSDLSFDSNWGRTSLGLNMSYLDFDYSTVLDGEWIRYRYHQDDYRPDPSQKYIVLQPEFLNADAEDSVMTYGLYAEQSIEMGNWTFRPGLRYDYDDLSSEGLVSPRLAVQWAPAPNWRYSATAGIFYQAPSMLDRTSDARNADLKYEEIQHVSLGVEHDINESWNVLAEVYYQTMDDLVVGSNSTDGLLSNDGEGDSYGLDMVLTKRFTDAWSANVTYSYNESSRDDKDGLPEYDADNHRPHVVTVGAQWDITERWRLGARYKFLSGTPADEFIVHQDVLGPGQPLRYSQEFTRENVDRNSDLNLLNVRLDYRRSFRSVDVIAYLDIVNLLGETDSEALELNPRTGRFEEQEGDTQPNIGLKFEWAW